MGEFVSRFNPLRHLRRRSKDLEPQPEPSSFTLFKDGRAEVLMKGVEVVLDAGIDDSTQATPFSVTPNEEYLTLAIRQSRRSNTFQWGMVAATEKEVEEGKGLYKFLFTVAESAFEERDGANYIRGTDIRVDDKVKPTNLYGRSWKIKFEPQIPPTSGPQKSS